MMMISAVRGIGCVVVRPCLVALAASLCLVACQPAEPPEATASAPAPELAAPAPEPIAPPKSPSVAPPMPVNVPDDEFVGWYFEQGGEGQLLACGQTAPLQVADATFLRELKRKLGGSSQPVYVRLQVRLAPGSRLEVTEVRQFGVDETPVVDCVLAAGTG